MNGRVQKRHSNLRVFTFFYAWCRFHSLRTAYTRTTQWSDCLLLGYRQLVGWGLDRPISHFNVGFNGSDLLFFCFSIVVSLIRQQWEREIAFKQSKNMIENTMRSKKKLLWLADERWLNRGELRSNCGIVYLHYNVCIELIVLGRSTRAFFTAEWWSQKRFLINDRLCINRLFGELLEIGSHFTHFFFRSSLPSIFQPIDWLEIVYVKSPRVGPHNSIIIALAYIWLCDSIRIFLVSTTKIIHRRVYASFHSVHFD